MKVCEGCSFGQHSVIYHPEITPGTEEQRERVGLAFDN